MIRKSTILDKLIMIVIAIFLLAPLIFTVVYSFARDLQGLLPQGFTLDAYTALFRDENILKVLLRTLIISIGPVLVSMLIILLAVYAGLRYYPKAFSYMNTITKIPYGIQGVILASSIIALYSGVGGIFRNRVFLLASAYVVFVFPYIYQGVLTTITSIATNEILDAAEILGQSPLKAFFTIIIPSTYRGLLSTGLLAAGLLFADFVLVNMIAGSYYPTLGIILNRTLRQSGAKAAAISTILGIVMLILSYLVNYFSRDKIIRKAEEEI